jgi:hypothetical protein
VPKNKTRFPLGPVALIAIGLIALLEKNLPSLALWPLVVLAVGVILLFKRILD